jgi:hypothetical protein
MTLLLSSRDVKHVLTMADAHSHEFRFARRADPARRTAAGEDPSALRNKLVAKAVENRASSAPSTVFSSSQKRPTSSTRTSSATSWAWWYTMSILTAGNDLPAGVGWEVEMRKEDRIRQQRQREMGQPGSQPRPEPRPQEAAKGRAAAEPQPRTPKQPGKIPLPD